MSDKRIAGLTASTFEVAAAHRDDKPSISIYQTGFYIIILY